MPKRLHLSNVEPSTSQRVREFDHSFKICTTDLQLVAARDMDRDAQLSRATVQEIECSPAAEMEALSQFGNGGVIGLNGPVRCIHDRTVDALGVTKLYREAGDSKRSVLMR
ncbi:hypothetical protein AMD26_009325 [Deinococcus sp. UR1]|nr:hypothetical protein AMD26_009325 [Deinococcus sp. UR1]